MIMDAVSGKDDIHVSAVGFGGGFTLGTLGADQFELGMEASASMTRFILNGATGTLSFDENGNGPMGQGQLNHLRLCRRVRLLHLLQTGDFDDSAGLFNMSPYP